MSGPVSPTAVIDLCDVSPRRITELAFLTAMLEQLPHASSCCITHPTVPTALLPRGAEVLSSWTTTAGLELVATDGRCVYRIEAYKTIVVTVSAPTQADATLATAAVLERAGDPPAGRFPAWVWHATDRGGTLRRRDLEGPAWPSVAHNYPPAARDRLTSLMARDGLESAEARLILLHGEPGTGKTTAIRALLRAWAPWCEAHIIGDPDRLFDNVAYLLEVVGRPPAHTAPTLTAAASGTAGSSSSPRTPTPSSAAPQARMPATASAGSSTSPTASSARPRTPSCCSPPMKTWPASTRRSSAPAAALPASNSPASQKPTPTSGSPATEPRRRHGAAARHWPSSTNSNGTAPDRHRP